MIKLGGHRAEDKDAYEGQSDNSGKAPVRGGRASRLRVAPYVKEHESNKKKGKKS